MYTVEPGTIAEVKGTRARVQIGIGVTTDFLDCPQVANPFKRFWSPLRVGEQCYVVAARGSINEGYIKRGSYCNEYGVPEGADENTETTVYEDGTKISYNTKTKQLNVALAGSANINIAGNASVTVGGSASISANAVNVKAKSAAIEADTANVKAETTHTGNLTVEGIVTATSVVGATVTVGLTGGSTLRADGGKFKIDRELEVSGNIKATGSVSDSQGNLRTNGGGN
jgi:phage baseplate assembly protein V